MLDYKFDKSAIYIAAVSYGSDSMAMLDMLQKEGVKPVVAAVDYHKFDFSSDDMAKLRDYCGEKGLVFRLLDSATLPPEEQFHIGESFHDWAKKLRYGWYKKLYEEYDAAALFLAHEQDDLIEAYLKAIDHKKDARSISFSKISTISGMLAVRPLLEFSKQDLLDYNIENNVPFNPGTESAIDQTTRSALRKDRIAKMNEIERENIIAKMKKEADETLGLIKSIERVKNDDEESGELEIRPLIALSKDDFVSAIVKFVQKVPSIKLKAKDFDAIREFCLDFTTNAVYPLKGGFSLVKDYDVLTLEKDINQIHYSYTLEAPGKLDVKEFFLDFSMGAEDRGIKDDYYPLTIRNALQSDEIKIHGYVEPVRKLYSLWNMPIELREVWPIFLNKEGKVIYVPRFRRKFSEYHVSILKIKG
jgi:tRNA(Ile)-lysidine synthetase-like protein